MKFLTFLRQDHAERYLGSLQSQTREHPIFSSSGVLPSTILTSPGGADFLVTCNKFPKCTYVTMFPAADTECLVLQQDRNSLWPGFRDLGFGQDWVRRFVVCDTGFTDRRLFRRPDGTFAMRCAMYQEDYAVHGVSEEVAAAVDRHGFVDVKREFIAWERIKRELRRFT